MCLRGGSPAAGGGWCLLPAAGRARGRLPSSCTALPPAGRGTPGACPRAAVGLLCLQRARQGKSQ